MFFQRYLDALGEMTFTTPIPPELQTAHNVLVIGDVSCGKSSLLNKLFNLRLKVGTGGTTEKVEAVFNDGTSIVRDSPGGNQDFAYYDPTTLNFIHGVSIVVVFYESSLGTVSDILRVCHKLKGRAVVCVRTKCDLYDPSPDCRSLDEEMERDRATAKSLAVDGLQFYKTACYGANTFDNDRVRALMNWEGNRAMVGDVC